LVDASMHFASNKLRLKSIAMIDKLRGSRSFPRRHKHLADRFQDYVAAHLSEPIYNRVVARALGTSIRSLHSAVVRILGQNPQSYIRNARLEAARAALIRAKPNTLVKVVARSCGFNHMGDFSENYLRQFGELPSETMRAAQ
jgi:AraC family transcriptional regulator, ethanolamine operon transcriptional activator